MSYYASTTATSIAAGGVAGRLSDWYLQDGDELKVTRTN
jgi:hypothetical protein